MSVVIPVHNHGDLLARAVASARAQLWPSIEFVIVDDGSVDGTMEVARALQADNVQVHQQPRHGPAGARNMGIRNARHPWIAFLDADDEWLPGKLSAQFASLSQQPAAAFSYGDAWVISRGKPNVLFTTRLTTEELRRVLLFGNRLATPTVVARRDCLFAAGLFDSSLSTGEDWDLWLRLAWRFEGAGVEVPVARVTRTRRHRPNVRELEVCTFRVLDKFFSTTLAEDSQVASARARASIYAWHQAVLSKSYLRTGDIPRAARLLAGGLRGDPRAFLLSFVGRRPLTLPPCAPR